LRSFTDGDTDESKEPHDDLPLFRAKASDPGLDRLLAPTRHFRHPDDVLTDATLNLQEKRAILSSWASDACAVESMPALRRPPGMGEPVTFDQVMDALRKLDAASSRQTIRIRHSFNRPDA
jgi:hypothetical protein